MKIIRKSLCLTLLFLLTACGDKGGVEKKYDPIFKQEICKVKIPRIIVGYGRDGDLLIHKEKNGIKTILITRDMSSVLLSDKNFENNPEVIFTTESTADGHHEFRYRAETLDAKRREEYHRIYTQGGGWMPGPSITHKNAANVVPVTLNDLKKIAFAEKVKLEIKSMKSSFKGTVTSSELKMLRDFVRICLS